MSSVVAAAIDVLDLLEAGQLLKGRLLCAVTETATARTTTTTRAILLLSVFAASVAANSDNYVASAAATRVR